MEDILARGTVIAGLGLIGSSFARAIKDIDYSYRVIGLDVAPDPVHKGIQDHVLDDGAVLGTEDDKARQLIQGAGFVILSMYPEGILDFIRSFRDDFKSGAVIIDICGLKGHLVADAQALMPDGVEYVATHPMAGREKSGYENGDGEMFLGASYILTPTEHNRPETLAMLKQMAGLMGFGKIREVTPEEHDEIIAYISHLPHVIAASLVNSWQGSEDIISFGGGSFRDATRVAELNADLWTQLFTRNREPLLKSMEQYMHTMETLYESLRDEDTEKLEALLNKASSRKQAWNRKVDRYDDGT